MRVPVGKASLALVAAAGLFLLAAQLVRLRDVRAYGSALPICRVDVSSNVVAMSFDDGPNPRFTPAILDSLRRRGARATFFVVGQRAERYPGLIDAELASSMEVGDHTWTHPHLSSLLLSDQMSEIRQTSHALVDLGATGRAGLLRAPFGEIGPDALRIAADDGFVAVGWSIAVDPYLDESRPRPAEVAEAIANDVRPGDIILAHDGGADRSTTVAMLPMLLEDLASRDVQVVPVGELLRAGRPMHATPQTWFWQSGFSCPP